MHIPLYVVPHHQYQRIINGSLRRTKSVCVQQSYTVTRHHHPYVPLSLNVLLNIVLVEVDQTRGCRDTFIYLLHKGPHEAADAVSKHISFSYSCDREVLSR